MARPKKDIRVSYRGELGRYQVQFVEDGGRWHMSPESDPETAARWARRNRARLIAKAAPKLRQFCAGFFDPGSPWVQRMRKKGHVYTRRYLETRQGYLDNYVIPEFGDDDPREITRRQIDDWLLSLGRASGGSKPLAGATKNKILYTIKIVFDDLIDREIVERNPVEGVRPYDKSPVKPRGALPVDALERLFPETHGALVRVWGSTMWAAMMLVLYDTGMRPGEMRALTWRDLYEEINFDTKASSWAFVVRKGIVSGTRADLKTTKNDMVKASGISERTHRELMAWKEETGFPGDDDFIFTQTGRAPLTDAGILMAFRRGLKRVGIEAEGWSPYWLRHTFVTEALRVLTPQQIADLAGHSVEVSRIYQHPTDEIILAKSKESRDTLERARKSAK